MSIALKARRNKLVSGAQGLIGEIGVAESALSPRGKVFVHGELWDAVSSSDIAAGQPVVVRRIDGLVLQVEPLPVTRTMPVSADPRKPSRPAHTSIPAGSIPLALPSPHDPPP